MKAFLLNGAGFMLTLVGLVWQQGTAVEKDSPKQLVAVLKPTEGFEAHGVVLFEDQGGQVHIRGKVEGLKPGKHGFHIHEFGDMRAADGTSAGGHYDPQGHKHGGPEDQEHHAGDFGNITANEQGVAQIDVKSDDFDLTSIVGRGLVVHAGADDLKSQPSGDAGARAAVAVIGVANNSDAKPTTSPAGSSR